MLELPQGRQPKLGVDRDASSVAALSLMTVTG